MTDTWYEIHNFSRALYWRRETDEFFKASGKKIGELESENIRGSNLPIVFIIGEDVYGMYLSGTYYEVSKINQPLCTMGSSEYGRLNDTGMLFELYPGASGIFAEDCINGGYEKRIKNLGEPGFVDTGPQGIQGTGPARVGIVKDSVHTSLQKEGIKNKHVGGSNAKTYRKSLHLPLTKDRAKTAEVDLEVFNFIEAFELNFAAGNIIKALPRLGKKDGVDEKYDLDKILFFVLRLYVDRGIITETEFWCKIGILGLLPDDADARESRVRDDDLARGSRGPYDINGIPITQYFQNNLTGHTI